MARARGLTLSCARRRTVSRRSCSSSGRSKCTGEGYPTARTGIFWPLAPDQPEMPPDSPEPDATDAPDTVATADAGARSRSDLQKELRKTHKKERKQRHRWRRRIIYTLSGLVLIAALGVGGLYAYTTYRFDQIKKIH